MKISTHLVRRCMAAFMILIFSTSLAFAGGTAIRDRSLAGQAVVLKSYVEGVSRLAGDDLQGALVAFKNFENNLIAAKDLSFEAEKKTIMTQLGQLLAEKDIAQVRRALAPLSISVIQLSQKAGFDQKGLNYFYCPMVGNYWASTSKEIKNPYYGASMCTCGGKVTGIL